MKPLSFHILQTNKSSDEAELRKLNRRAFPHEKISEQVRKTIGEVRRRGNAALCALTKKWDGIELEPGELMLRRSPEPPSRKVRSAISYSLQNIRRFSRAHRPRDWRMRNQEGALVGEQYSPFTRVGLYVPGGTAPLVSSALMTVAIAQVAGVPEIVVTTPPPVNNDLHFALHAAGATEIYQVGGAQAIAALAYGTESLKPVQKIFGPGNVFVVEAKRQVLGAVSIDQLPGPSEVAILADSSAEPTFAAADLLAQAEHGPGSLVLVVSTSEKFLKRVLESIHVQLPRLKRQKYLVEVLRKGTQLVFAKNMAEAVKLIEEYAPEHLALMTKNPRLIAKSIRHAGAIFLGGYSPVAAGDFLAGPSHTLPTGGAGKSFSGLTVDQFFKRTSLVEYTPRSLKMVAPHLETFAEIEQLDAHGHSIQVRLEAMK